MRRLLCLLMFAPVLSASAMLSGCGSDEGSGEGDATLIPGEAAGSPTAGMHPYQPHFDAAAKEFSVPASLLVAIGYAETQLYHVPGDTSEFDGVPAAYGVMALRGDALAKGASLVGLSEEEVQSEPEANIRAAAALLDAHAEEMGLDRADIGAWAPAVAAYFNHPSLDAQAHFVHDEVYRHLREGIAAPEDSGIDEILAANPEATPKFPKPQFVGKGGPANAVYSGSIWRPAPSSNYTSGRGGKKAELLVIHTCAGTYAGCWGWLTTPYPTNPNKTSAHYVVNESGSEISALVDEVNTAHHVGASWNGLPTNPRSVGIEHGGYPYTSANPWKEGQIAASAKLSCDIVKRQNIIRDRQHIIGHYQPDPVNRANDPGTGFPWADYMNRINTCVDGGGGGGSTTITVDSNNANNNSAVARIVAPSANWTSSTNVSGYYGTGYYAAPTAAISDGATFEFYLAAAGSKQVYAWWTSASDRSTTTPFVMFNASGTNLGSVSKNQQTGGGAWQLLGTYNFTAGWNKVVVSRWTTTGYQVIADAVQIR
ncbi:N-acetylmuramoyl-L-alanine amidase [Polyangium fumosum]|nr:N-acetylmuramoyl-L-alanine amidase [Polyangium fumosum]